MQQYDKIIIGAGLYGLYSALFCAKRGQHVLVLEHDDAAFKRTAGICDTDFIIEKLPVKGYNDRKIIITFFVGEHI